MNRTLTGFLGAAQGAFGLLCAASKEIDSAIGSSTLGNVFNLVSGAAFGALGFGAPENVQRVGVPIVSGLNGLMGILGVAGVRSIGGMQLNHELLPNLINMGIAVLGFVFTIIKGKK